MGAGAQEATLTDSNFRANPYFVHRIAIDMISQDRVFSHFKIPGSPDKTRGSDFRAFTNFGTKHPQKHAPPSVHKTAGRGPKSDRED
jgi:hypothetical protein